MTNENREMKLGLLISPSGSHRAAWRHPDFKPEQVSSLAHFAYTARKAEAGKFDFVFLADTNAAYQGSPEEQERSKPALMLGELRQTLEPLTLLAAIAASTNHIGLVASATTTYNEPFTIARKFASLDHLSEGRAAWNVVTSSNSAEAWNFSRDAHMKHEDRYSRAREFLDVVCALWDSMEDDAFVYDKQAGIVSDAEKVHFIDHHGPHFSVRGPLNVMRPPQGHPVIVQAGSSADGIDFAGKSADVVFTAQRSMEGARRFREAIRESAVRHGRSADAIKVMPGLSPIIGRTEQEANAKLQQLHGLIHPAFGLFILSDLFGVDLSGLSVDAQLPEDLPVPNGMVSRSQLIREAAAAQKLTIRQVYEKLLSASGHFAMCGTPVQIADEMERWLANGAADGFNIMPPQMPEGIDDFVDMVVPELQSRGLFRTDYKGSTLRENLGLDRPANRFAAVRDQGDWPQAGAVSASQTSRQISGGDRGKLRG